MTINRDELENALAHYARHMVLAQGDYEVAAMRTAQRAYMWGAFAGTAALASAIGLLAVILGFSRYSPMDDARVAAALGCAIAGALGATASVSWRVTIFAELRVDAGASILTLRGMGAIRPLIGAIFGLALYFALKSGFIDIGEDRNFYFFAFLSFVAGFSERAVPELLRTAEAGVGGQPPIGQPPP